MKEFHAPAGDGPALSALAVRLAAGLLVGAMSLAAFPLSAVAQNPPAEAVEAAQPPTAQRAARAGAQRAVSAPPTAKYEDVVTQRSFVLDRSGGELLLKFDDSPEVFVLQSTPAQRGDSFLRSDTGQIILRVTEPGNVISYIGDADGAPADIAGVAAPLDRPAMTSSLAELVKDSRERLTRLAGHDVTIFGAAEFARNEEWVADALLMMVFGVEQANSAAPRSAQKVKAVRVVNATAPGATLKDGELVLSLNPADGYAGRPSSAAIAKVITSAK